LHPAKPGVEILLLDVEDSDRHADIGEAHGNAAAHGARADDADAIDRAWFHARRNAGNLAHFALGEKQVPQRARLGRLFELAG